ncbi:hypothetical protein WJR50_03425 [Catalinimonas sp. 4WD22]|uniref:hypothetical protein n=1 Tax=Catalinimonas locisalis TaxID=3133978 RepID=UPI003100FCCA
MKKLHWLMIITVLMCFSSCNPKITTSISNAYSPLDYKQEVVVMGLDQAEPDGAENLGQVKIGDTGFSTKCSYDIVIDKARLEARKVGGNAIKIIEHRPPSAMGSACHRITANILKIENIENYSPKMEEEVLVDVDYAILNVYRYGGTGALVNYDLHLGDSVICRVKNNYKTTLHINKDGLNTLWAKTEAKSEVPIDVKMGKTYYLRCGVTMGAFVGRPKLDLIDSKTGKSEFESFKAKNQ